MGNPPPPHQQWDYPPYLPPTMTYHPPYQWPPLPPPSSAQPVPYPDSRPSSTCQHIIHPPPMHTHDTESNHCHSPLLPYEEGEEELDEPGPLPTDRASTHKTRRPPARHSLPQINRSKGNSRSRSISISDTGVPSTTTGDESTTTAIFLPDPTHPPIHLRGVNKHGLLPAPPGAILDVNDLLMLHPPDKVDAIAGHSSQFEMYTCRVCSKTYDGKNARSVARRHLQDKHGVPLSVQKRRSRWDMEPDRPKSQQDANERNLKSKRNWAVKNRQQGKLESAHSAFLERFGPNGVVTACGTRLVAPKFRGGGALALKGQFLDGEYGKVIIPEDILRGVQMIRERDGKRVVDADNRPEEKPAAESQPKAKGKGRKKATTVSEGSSTLRPSVSVNIPAAPRPITSAHSSPSSSSSTGPDYYQASITQTPVSTARTYIQEPAYPFQQTYYFPPTLMGMQDNGYQYMFHAQAQMPIDPVIQEEDSPLPTEVEPPLTARTDRSHASPPHMAMPLQQQWLSSETWSTMEQHSQMDIQAQPVPQAQLEPAHEIEPQWQRMHLADWESSDGSGGMDGIKEGSVETEGEAMAAESLLNLHSTPIRGPGETPTSRLTVTVVDENSDGATEKTAFGPVDEPAQLDGGAQSNLLEAPTLPSPVPVRPIRSRSFIQPFRDPRPEITRSLSFDNSTGLDDPFVLEPTPAKPTHTHSSSTRRGKRHTISAPSPSPLSTTQRKRKEVPSSPMGAPPAPRSVLKPVSNSAANMNRRGSAIGFGAFQTPLKGGAGVHFQNPTSMTKFGGGGGWLFSSPGIGDAAASLGLVPTHLAPSTPGIRGIVGADTPEMSILEARAKKRRSEM